MLGSKFLLLFRAFPSALTNWATSFVTSSMKSSSFAVYELLSVASKVTFRFFQSNMAQEWAGHVWQNIIWANLIEACVWQNITTIELSFFICLYLLQLECAQRTVSLLTWSKFIRRRFAKFWGAWPSSQVFIVSCCFCNLIFTIKKMGCISHVFSRAVVRKLFFIAVVMHGQEGKKRSMLSPLMHPLAHSALHVLSWCAKNKRNFRVMNEWVHDHFW